jgi:hypothetical protein
MVGSAICLSSEKHWPQPPPFCMQGQHVWHLESPHGVPALPV